MFKKFVQQPVEHKRFVLPSGDYLNYIEMRGAGAVSAAARNHPGAIPDSLKPKKPTLILMHGYGSGLGMFFGEFILDCIVFVLLLFALALSVPFFLYFVHQLHFDRSKLRQICDPI